MEQHLGKRLACKRCQYKKLKCSRSEPCEKCRKAGLQCEYRSVDRKRKPASQDHVAMLQDRVSWLEGFIVGLRDSSPCERETRLRGVNFNSVPSTNHAHVTIGDPFKQQLHTVADLHVGSDGSLAYHGPTSIYRVQMDYERFAENNEIPPVSDESLSSADHVLEHFGIDIADGIITQCLILFFKWQYPNFMFVYRDAFLRDHFGDRDGSKYWSLSLLLSICALGSLMLPDSEKKCLGEQFYGAAESIAMVTGLTRPSITRVQTFLCLAFYEIGRGNLSKGWAYSGIAFRVAQDIGFQKDPETWIFHHHITSTYEDVEVRRRIYWGCYVSDKLVSLILGRPAHLPYNEAQVKEPETQPDPSFIMPWRSVGFDDDASQEYTDKSMVPYIKQQIKLARIIERMLSSLFSPKSSLDAEFRRQSLDSFNIDLLQWKTQLPGWADFNVWDVIDQPLKPSMAALHLLYNSARVALNYEEALPSSGNSYMDRARQVCIVSATEITSLLRRYRHHYGLRYTPLIIVYGIAQAIRTTKAFGTAEEAGHLVNAMSECSSTWGLADKVRRQRL